MISPKQIRAGRALIGWSQSDLAAASGLSIRTIKYVEKGKSCRADTHEAIYSALARHVDFPKQGVALR